MPTGQYIRTPRGPYKLKRPILVIGPSIAYIPLTKGQFACVDVEDVDLVSQYNWYTSSNSNGNTIYANRRPTKIPGESKRQTVSMHTFLLGLNKEHFTADHITPGNRLDNRRANLRPANREQQVHNTRKPKNNTSGIKGVDWRPAHRKWRARLASKGETIHLGYFLSKEDAFESLKKRALDLRGEFCRF